MSESARKLRKHLNADALIKTMRQRFDKVTDTRVKPAYTLSDSLMSAFAMFALKDPSLLAFDQRRKEVKSNLHTVFGIDKVPCDSQMREILDPVEPESLRPAFTDIFSKAQRGKVLKQYVFHEGRYLLSFDGTQTFSSKKIHCEHCLSKTHENGTVTYHHQMLACVLVHPDVREVIPLMPEAILKQDGTTKNDCELNAAKRFFVAFREDHPHLPVIATGDALTANAPLILLMRRLDIVPLLVAKPGNNSFLFQQMETAFAEGRTEVFSYTDATTKVIHHCRWLTQVPLNESHPDVLVNMLEYWEIEDGSVIFYGSWVTDLELRENNVSLVVRGARAHWKIENDTFNTLKNQGYHLEHNFGHGKQNLSVVLSLLMLLAFASDQLQQLSCALFQAAWEKTGSKKQLWEEMRHLFYSFALTSMADVYEAIMRGIDKQKPILLNSS